MEMALDNSYETIILCIRMYKGNKKDKQNKDKT